jgi:hypothetical protein
MSPGLWFIETKEEREAYHQKWIKNHYLKEGKRYTFTIEKQRRDFYNIFRGHTYSPYIKQADCPWMSVCLGPKFSIPWQATKWAKDYLKRGGPPEGYFDPPPPDPNIVVYKPS